jgi:hypothetical protein
MKFAEIYEGINLFKSGISRSEAFDPDLILNVCKRGTLPYLVKLFQVNIKLNRLKWLRHYATSRKVEVSGSIPDVVTGFFN